MSRFASRKQEIAGRFSQAADHYASYAALQAAIADALLAADIPSGVVLDAGCGRGRESQLLSARPDIEKVIALDMAPAMLAALPASPKIQPLLGDMEAIALPDACVDAVFSNFAMQWCESADTVAAEFSRVLKPGGRLLASVPGPQSLAALRATGLLHINEFAGTENWAMALMQAGFADCDFVQKDFSLHFDTVPELLRALKGIGAGTSDTPRENHLLGRQWLQQVTAALEAQRQPQGLPLSYDVIFIIAGKE
ncbi:MAG: methyltransferase domain-containing protein [Moraxellaceae bacterium]